MCISLVSLLGGILNSLSASGSTPLRRCCSNLTLIVALLFFHAPGDPLQTARVQAIAVSVSGVLQLLWLIVATRQAKVTLRLRMPRLSPDVKRLLKLIWPAAAGAGAVQFNLLVSTGLAYSLLPEGAPSYIYYADRLNQLPLGLIGIGLARSCCRRSPARSGVATTPGAMETQNRGMELALFLTLPATVALGRVWHADRRRAVPERRVHRRRHVQCAQVLAAFSLGLPAYILVKVLTPGFYARHDTKTRSSSRPGRSQ